VTALSLVNYELLLHTYLIIPYIVIVIKKFVSRISYRKWNYSLLFYRNTSDFFDIF